MANPTTYTEAKNQLKTQQKAELATLKARQKNDDLYAKNKHKADLVALKENYTNNKNLTIKSQKEYIDQLNFQQKAAVTQLKNTHLQQLAELYNDWH